jgi:hypothetical protein
MIDRADIAISKHAYDRAKERFGWKPRTLRRMLPRVLDDGLCHRDMKGHLKKWASRQFLAYKATDMRVYGQFCFFFKGNTLVTVYRLPSNVEVLSTTA